MARPLSDEMALRIGLASRQFPGVSLEDWVGILIRAVGLPLSPERTRQLRLRRLRDTGGACLRDFSDEQLRTALACLRGQGVDLRITVPVPRPYRGGDMPGSIRVACASNRSERIDAPFGTCARLLIYQVSVQEVRLIDVREQSCEPGAEQRYAGRIRSLGDCHVLCTMTLGATAAARVVRAGLYPVVSHVPEQAPGLLRSLQRVMEDTPPPWMVNLMQKSARALPEPEEI